MTSGVVHIPTDENRATVEALSSYGVPAEEIARYIGVANKTLYKYYQSDLDNAKTKKTLAVGSFLYNAASGQAMAEGANHAECLKAAMFWAKTRMQWRETNNLDVTSNGESINKWTVNPVTTEKNA